MVRWSSLLISSPEISDAVRQVQGLVVSAIKSASRVLPAEFDANNSTFEFNLESLRGHQGVALAVVLGSASLLLISQWPSSKKKHQTVLDALENDPDLCAFIAFYKRLSPQGPFDKPDLGCPGSDFIVLAPTNEAFQDARTRIFPLTEPDWRKMLLSHVIHSPLQHSELIELDSIPSCTLALAKLDCLRGSYTDGTRKDVVPHVCSNGRIYSIREVLLPGEQSEAGTTTAGA